MGSLPPINKPKLFDSANRVITGLREQLPVGLGHGVMFIYWDEKDKHKQIPSTNRWSRPTGM